MWSTVVNIILGAFGASLLLTRSALARVLLKSIFQQALPVDVLGQGW